MKLGILGGSFNPPQKDHFRLAEYTIDHLGLDQVVFVPMKDNPLKPNLVHGNHRYQMLKRYTDQNPKLSVSRIELDAETQLKTYQTLEQLQAEYPEATLYFILGADNFVQIKTWAHYQFLLTHYHFIISHRFGIPLKEFIEEEVKEYQDHFTIIPEIGSASSTLVREKLRKQESILDDVPQVVVTYIAENHLYEGENL